MTIRIIAFALVVALVGGAVACADPGSSQAVAVAIDDGPAADLARPTEQVTLVLPIRQLIVPAMPQLAALTPRLHVESLFRPPRG